MTCPCPPEEGGDLARASYECCDELPFTEGQFPQR
jgi:hypothetical protein